jgi:hypothetical protein
VALRQIYSGRRLVLVWPGNHGNPADFGAVSVFNFDTFTTADLRRGMGVSTSPTSATQLASLLLLAVMLVLILTASVSARGVKVTDHERPRSKGALPPHMARFLLLQCLRPGGARLRICHPSTVADRLSLAGTV